MANKKINISIVSMMLLAFALISSCNQQIKSVTKSEKPYYCIKGNFSDLKIRFGKKIKMIDSTKKETIKYFGYQINTNGEVIFFDDRNSSKEIVTRDLAVLNDQDYCKIYHWSKKIVLDQPVLNEIGDTLKFFEFVNEPTGIYQRNSWHPYFDTKGSVITRNYMDSIQSVLRNYLKNMID